MTNDPRLTTIGIEIPIHKHLDTGLCTTDRDYSGHLSTIYGATNPAACVVNGRADPVFVGSSDNAHIRPSIIGFGQTITIYRRGGQTTSVEQIGRHMLTTKRLIRCQLGDLKSQAAMGRSSIQILKHTRGSARVEVRVKQSRSNIAVLVIQVFASKA